MTPEIRLVIFDPIGSYLGSKDSNSMDEMRQILDPLARSAERFGVAIIAIMHYNKRAEVRYLRALGRLDGIQHRPFAGQYFRSNVSRIR